MFLPHSLPPPESLDAGMRASLAGSLTYLHDALKSLPDFDGIAIDGAVNGIRTHRVPPRLFGRYYDLVLAARAARYAEAAALFYEIIELAAKAPALAVVPFTEDALGKDRARYGRLVGGNTDSPTMLAAPDPRDWTNFKNNVLAALKLIDRADEGLAAEARALVAEVVGAGPSREKGVRTFGGISSFMLWGAVFLNTEKHRTTLDLFDGLAHETAHHVLFGLSPDEPLVTNAIEERYASPLRPDPRPMDGVFHATFVCARLHYAFERLQDMPKPTLSSAEQQLARDRMQSNARRFRDGYETVRRFGKLSETGERIISAAADYMQHAA